MIKSKNQVRSLRVVGAAIGILVATSVGAWQQSRAPWVVDFPNGGTGCEPLPDDQITPIQYDVTFEGDIRGFIAVQCNSCHVNSSSGNFNVSFSNARLQLIGALETGTPSSANPAFLRVRPFRPQDSLFFEKLNCASPPVGGPMPIGGSASVQFQALVYDWIAAGALMPDSPGGDRLSVGTFEVIVRP